MKKAIVLGNGRSGKAASEILRREGYDVTLLDGNDVFPENEAFDLCVTSPGIALTHPWQQTAREKNIPVISELQLGAGRWIARGGKMLGVTGSKGKSSVVKLIADTLNASGRKAIACGNYGIPLCEVCVDNDAENDLSGFWAVVEVSSFQLETTTLPGDAFVAAAILNLQEDHLDRHESREVYHNLKRKLLGMAKVKISDGCNSSGIALLSASYFDNKILRTNGMCAIELMRAAGLSDNEIADGFAKFKALPHRMQLVCEHGGVRWIDDSKATSLDALCAGVSMCDGGVRLIAGGLPKGDDPRSAIAQLKSSVKKVYLIGMCANDFYAAWRDHVQCELCGNLEIAVANILREVQPGETVLLSPGTASFDQFKSYSARGDAFAALVPHSS